MTAPRSIYSLSPKQEEAMFHLGLDPRFPNPNPVDELGFGGAAGGGKSALMRAVALTLSQKWPGSYGAIFRRQETQLKRTHIPKFRQEIPGKLYKWIGSKPPQMHFNSPQIAGCAEFSCPPNVPCQHSSIVEFNHVDKDIGVEKYDSVEWNWLMIDERQQFTHEEVSYLVGRVRATRAQTALWKDWHPLVLYGFNPGGADHTYLREEFVKRAEKEKQPWQRYAEDGTEGLKRFFIMSLLDDNPFIDVKQYERTLAGMTPEHFRRLRYGDWDFFEGQFFKQFEDDLHVVPAFIPPAHWPRAWGFDWGEASPSCFLVSAMNPETGDIFTYDEYYSSGPTGQHIQEVSARLNEMPTASGMRLPGWADPRMWETVKGDEWNRVTVAQQFVNAGIPIQQARGTRAGQLLSLQLMQEPRPERVHPFNGKLTAPTWYITANCDSLINEIRGAPYAEDMDEMVKENDHAIDAARFHVSRLAAPTSALSLGPKMEFAFS
jgi:hypothetical protein|tara:strand:+ start:3709 stop:5178 length:1470 start_codon:yes stop_codon:yes gene_type:complete